MLAMRTRVACKPLRFYEAGELMPVLVTPGGRIYIGIEPPVITEVEEDENGTDSPGVGVRR